MNCFEGINMIKILHSLIFPSALNDALGLRGKTTLNLQNESDGGSRDHDDDNNDCIKDRKIALEDKSVSDQF